MDRQEGYMETVRGNAAHLCMVPVTVEGTVPLLALQDAVVNSRLAVQATADPQGLLQIPGKHLPLPGASLVPVHVVVLGASVLVQQEGVDCHVVDQLQAQSCVGSTNCRRLPRTTQMHIGDSHFHPHAKLAQIGTCMLQS